MSSRYRRTYGVRGQLTTDTIGGSGGGGSLLGESTRWADVADFASLPTEDLRNGDRCRTSDTGWLWQYDLGTTTWLAREVFVLTQAQLPSSDIAPGALASIGSSPNTFWEQSGFVWDTTQWVRIQEDIPFVWNPVDMGLTAVTDNFKTAGDIVAALPGFLSGDKMIYNGQSYKYRTVTAGQDEGGVGFGCWVNECFDDETLLGGAFFNGSEANFTELSTRGVATSYVNAEGNVTYPGSYIGFNTTTSASSGIYYKVMEGDFSSASKTYIRMEVARTTSGVANRDVFFLGFFDSGKGCRIYSAEASDSVAKTAYYTSGFVSQGSLALSYGTHTTFPTIASGNFDIIEIIDKGKLEGSLIVINGTPQGMMIKDQQSEALNNIQFGAFSGIGGVTLNVAIRNALFCRF